MRYFLCLAIVAVCEAARIPRVSEQSYFSNYPNYYQGHDYENGHGAGHAGVPPLFAGAANDFYGHQGPIGGRAGFANHLTGVPFPGLAPNHVGANHGPIVPRHHGGRFNQGFDYDYPV